MFALDAATGKELWIYDPAVPGHAGSRAAVTWSIGASRPGRAGSIVGTLDGRLIALDAATGKPVWDVRDHCRQARRYTITGAPRIVKGKVIIGNGGGGEGARLHHGL